MSAVNYSDVCLLLLAAPEWTRLLFLLLKSTVQFNYGTREAATMHFSQTLLLLRKLVEAAARMFMRLDSERSIR